MPVFKQPSSIQTIQIFIYPNSQYRTKNSVAMKLNFSYNMVKYST
ncbi:hypothetical protein HMPREF9370_2193 [Neisseria wadsworthii 9715]|uniref:Uncharacterized protein n=1 Tax=Neisseria wadsworthii 9715 TaxID=1030841 RepID=G4CSY3_9NEIS|nr:hypothetical protein HMPREF9370_2193 [Neisseria wadsworthii 9715]